MRFARASLLFMCVLSISAAAASAQVKKGYIDLGFGGSLGWSESDFGTGTNRQFGIAVNIDSLYFVTDRIAVGGSTSLSYSDLESSDGWIYQLGPALDYHFRPAKDIVPLVGLTGGFHRGETDLDPSGDRTTQGWFAAVYGGADFFLNDHVALNLLLRARRIRTEFEQSGPGTPQRFNNSFNAVSILVGISIFIDTKKGR